LPEHGLEHETNYTWIESNSMLTTFQPLEVVKTTMAANRSDGFAGALSRIWGRGGVLGCKY